MRPQTSLLVFSITVAYFCGVDSKELRTSDKSIRLHPHGHQNVPKGKFTVPAVVKFNAAVVKLNCCFFPEWGGFSKKEPFVSIFYQFSQLWTEDNGLNLPESCASSKRANFFMFLLFWDLAAVSSPQASSGIRRLIAKTEWPDAFRGDKRKTWLMVSHGREPVTLTRSSSLPSRIAPIWSLLGILDRPGWPSL